MRRIWRGRRSVGYSDALTKMKTTVTEMIPRQMDDQDIILITAASGKVFGGRTSAAKAGRAHPGAFRFKMAPASSSRDS